MKDNRRRSRTQSLPLAPNEEIETNYRENIKDYDEKIEFDGEGECFEPSKKPFIAPKGEIAQARRLNEKMCASPSHTESPTLSAVSNADSTAPSVLGSIYSIGGAVWSFIRGPVETDSNDGISSASGHCHNKSKSFAFSSPKMTATSSLAASEIDEGSDLDSDSSDAPDFGTPSIHSHNDQSRDHCDQLNSSSPKQQSKILAAEPGKGKIVFGRVEPFCTLIGREFPEDEHVLSISNISTIQSQIPARWKVYNDWILLYSTRGNGFSLTTLYHQLKRSKGPLIISVKDEYGAVFGAFLNQSLQPRQGHYGNGECFLWTITPESVYTKYPSTGKNNYFIITEPDYLAIGCGGGKFGLWLEKELFKGISDPVPTFDNDQLSTKQQFECIAIEIWGLDLNE